MAASFRQDPSVLAAATLRGVDDERAALEGHACQAAWHHRALVAVAQHVRPKIHMAGLDAVLKKTRGARQRQRRLSNVVPRVGDDATAEFLALGRRAVR